MCLIDEKTNEIIFQNTAASNGLKFSNLVSQSLNVSASEGKSAQKLDQSVKIYAPIELKKLQV